jgi:hypothetical protein
MRDSFNSTYIRFKLSLNRCLPYCPGAATTVQVEHSRLVWVSALSSAPYSFPLNLRNVAHLPGRSGISTVSNTSPQLCALSNKPQPPEVHIRPAHNDREPLLRTEELVVDDVLFQPCER